MSALELALRDGVRGARFVVRRIASDPTGRVQPEEGEPRGGLERILPGARLLRPVAQLADRVATRLARLDPTAAAASAHGPAFELLPVDAYLKGPPERFARDLYAAAKLLVAQTGRVNAFVSEQVLAQAHGLVLARHSDLVAARQRRVLDDELPTAGSAEVVLGAALALAIAELRPILRMDVEVPDGAGPRHFARFPNLYLGCVVGVALAAGRPCDEGDEHDAVEFLARVDLVVDARFERLRAASRGADPLAAMAEAFVPLLRALG